jgi:hypothetical protein
MQIFLTDARTFIFTPFLPHRDYCGRNSTSARHKSQEQIPLSVAGRFEQRGSAQSKTAGHIIPSALEARRSE